MDDFDQRLRQRLSALDAAVPAARAGVHVIDDMPASRRGHGVRVASKFPIGLAAALAMVMIGVAVVGVDLLRPPATVPVASGTGTTPSASPSGSSVILGSDGLPAEIDGQHVYRVADRAEWQNLSGSFLLAAALPSGAMPACPYMPASSIAAENDLLAHSCGGWSLGSTTGSGLDRANFVYAAPKSSPYTLLIGWANHAVVLRVHTHDPEAAGCSAENRAACEAAAVVEAVVWPTVPSEIDGEQVYRHNDLVSLYSAGTFKDLKSSFLLGGLVSVGKVDWAPGTCATAATGQQVLSQLFSDCVTPYVSIDSEQIAPKSSFAAVDGQVVVVRAHMNDPLAADCPADQQTRCEQAIVVESVVWSSNPYAKTTPTPLPTPSGTPFQGPSPVFLSPSPTVVPSPEAS